MKLKRLKFTEGFRVIPGNRHRGADQWLFAVDGRGEARVRNRRYRLAAGTLPLIEHGERHEIKNTGRALLRTLNFYVPPACTRQGDELPRVKR